MKRILLLCLLISALCLLAACAQPIKMAPIDANLVPDTRYESLLYVGGIGKRWRAAFLKEPASTVPVKPWAETLIEPAIGSFKDAIDFMRTGARAREIRVERVMLHDKPVGYLLTLVPNYGEIYVLETLIWEKGGTVYFSVREPTDLD